MFWQSIERELQINLNRVLYAGKDDEKVAHNPYTIHFCDTKYVELTDTEAEDFKKLLENYTKRKWTSLTSSNKT